MVKLVPKNSLKSPRRPQTVAISGDTSPKRVVDTVHKFADSKH